jgi:hypothetical protein
LYWLGTDRGRDKAWRNPAQSGGAVRASCSSTAGGSVDAICGRGGENAYTVGSPNSWYQFEFVDIAVKVQAYTMTSRKAGAAFALRGWKLLGSADGAKWFVIDQHSADNSWPNANDCSKTFVVADSKKPVATEDIGNRAIEPQRAARRAVVRAL